jgi:hypothetical protein
VKGPGPEPGPFLFGGRQLELPHEQYNATPDRRWQAHVETGRYAARPETLAAIRKAFEKAGVEFINGAKPGVRLR